MSVQLHVYRRVLHINESASTPADPMNGQGQKVLSSTASLSSYKARPLTSFVETIHVVFGLPLFPPSCIFSHITIFSKELCLLSMCQSRTALVLPFLPPVNFQVSSAAGHTCLSRWWSRVCIELCSSSTFQMSHFFSCHLSSVSDIHTHTY